MSPSQAVFLLSGMAASRISSRTMNGLTGAAVLMLLILIGVAALGFWGWTLGEVIAQETDSGGKRTTWMVVVLAAGLLGAILYRVVRRPERIRELGS